MDDFGAVEYAAFGRHDFIFDIASTKFGLEVDRIIAGFLPIRTR